MKMKHFFICSVSLLILNCKKSTHFMGAAPAPVATKSSSLQIKEIDPPPAAAAPAVPTNAIVKGSFTAWTEPVAPRPRQDYTVVIKVTLPPHLLTNYSKADIVGSVVRTDGYRHVIGAGKRETFFIEGQTPYYYLYIPGAEKLVQDTIMVRSTVLNEEQELKIIF